MVIKNFTYVSGPRMGTNNSMKGIFDNDKKVTKKNSSKKKRGKK